MYMFMCVSTTFLIRTDAVSVVFNISSWHANTNLPEIPLLKAQFVLSKDLPVSQVLSHLQSHVLGFHI